MDSMKWISVKDGFPNEYRDVLIYYPDFRIISAYLISELGKLFCWRDRDGNGSEMSHKCDKITHWMPLPAAPHE